MRVLTWLHRWCGVVFCLLFAMWFASGIVMHFVPFPARSEGPLAPGVDVQAAAETVDYDQWTVAGDFDFDRPLRRIILNDQAGTEIYVSSRSGRVVLTTTRGVRLMNYVGSIPHWLYATQLRHQREAWSTLMWWLSLLATIGAAIGVIVGLVRFRSGSTYRGLQRWHHIFGLIFAPFLLAWIFSGFLSLVENWPLRSFHTLDFALLAQRPLLRSTVIVALCLCGFAFSLTGAVLGWRRLKASAG
jgi:PepSY-associated TM region